MKLGVFIHTNKKQLLGALVSAYSMRRNAAAGADFDVQLIQAEEHAFLAAREGQMFLRSGEWQRWRMEDLQSFTPLRFMPPELMGYEGRALVVDPDVFAVGDVCELLRRDLDGKAILCRKRPGREEDAGGYASSVMLLDCAKLAHWRTEQQFAELFEGTRDYKKWIELSYEDPASIGLFERSWNDFDRLEPDTKLLHNTKRNTQPWKTGLPVDFVMADRFRLFPPKNWGRRARRLIFGDYRYAGHYKRHPDPNQERFFFDLLRECLDKGMVSEDFLRSEMAARHIRPDALEVLERSPAPAS